MTVRLRVDAAPSMTALRAAFEQTFGKPLVVTDGYRTLAGQVDVQRKRPGLAAKPGTSKHGLGIAVDLGSGVNRFGTAEHQWMRANAARYGWYHPAWAQQDGSKPEAWHWELIEPGTAAG